MITLRGIVWIILLISIVSVKPKPINDGDSDNNTNVCDNDKQCENKSSNKDNILSSVISLFTENTQNINEKVQDAIGGLNFLNHFPSFIKRRDTTSVSSGADYMHVINKRSDDFNEADENGNKVNVTGGVLDDSVSKTTIVALNAENNNFNTTTVNEIRNPTIEDLQKADIIDVREIQNNGTDFEVIIENKTQEDNILPTYNDENVANKPNTSEKEIRTDYFDYTTDSDTITNIAINNNTLLNIDNKLSTVTNIQSVTATDEYNPALYNNSSTEINVGGNKTTARNESGLLIHYNVTETESLTFENDSSNIKNLSQNSIVFANINDLDSQHLYDAPENNLNYISPQLESEKKIQDHLPEYKNSNNSYQVSLLSNNPDLDFTKTGNGQNNILQQNTNEFVILNTHQHKNTSGNLIINNNISKVASTLLNVTLKEVITKDDETINSYVLSNDSFSNNLNIKSNSSDIDSLFKLGTVTVDDNVSMNNDNYNKAVTYNTFQNTDIVLKAFNTPKNITNAVSNNSRKNKITKGSNYIIDNVSAIDANNEKAKEFDSSANNCMPNFNGRPPRVKLQVDFFVDNFMNFVTSPKKYLENKIAQLFVPQN